MRLMLRDRRNGENAKFLFSLFFFSWPVVPLVFRFIILFILHGINFVYM